MIISHKYRYVFIQNPRTASSSIGKELCQLYDGERVLSKHASYSDFLNTASKEERHYFAFTGQRNPLDAFTTLYFRARHEKLKRVKANPELSKWRGMTQQINHWRYIDENNLTLAQYFYMYHSRTIDSSYRRIERQKMNFVYRYENLQHDFSIILRTIGIAQKRELPRHSKQTQNKDCDFYQYFTPDIQPRVQIVFGASFKEMGYSFPSEWEQPYLADWLAFYRDLALRIPGYVATRLFSR